MVITKLIKFFMGLSLSLVLIFFTLGLFEAKNNGLSFIQIGTRLADNLKSSDVFKNNNNYVKVNNKENIPIDNINEIRIDSDYFNIKYLEDTKNPNNISIEFEGDIINEMASNFYKSIREDNILYLKAFVGNISNPTTKGINMIVRVGSNYKRPVFVNNKRGNTDINCKEINYLDIYSESGNINAKLGKNDAEVNLFSNSGNVEIETLGKLNGSIKSVNGNLNVASDTLKGDFESEYGNIILDYNNLYGDISIQSVEGNITVVSKVKYNYYVSSGTGYVDSYGYSELAATQEFDKSVYDYRINASSSTGNIVINFK